MAKTLARMRRSYQLYLILSVPLAYLIIFKYFPMYGAQIAFRDFTAARGIWGSPWVGMLHFRKFFASYQFRAALTNTLALSVYDLAVSFPVPIFLALCLNDLRFPRLKKTVQMVTYAPHFISVVVLCSMVLQILSLKSGVLNKLIELLGGTAVNFIGRPDYFRTIYVLSGVWQNAGWGTILFLATLSSVDPALHEAATIDGATKLQKTLYINIPTIAPTIVILLILNAGKIMNVGFEKILLLQNPLNNRTSETIQTYVYKVGLNSSVTNFSYASAIGLFNSVVNLALIVAVNQLSKRFSENSLW